MDVRPACHLSDCPLHGRISAQSARLIGYGLDLEGDAKLWCEAEVRQVALFGECLVLQRRIEIGLFESRITIHDTVTNRGFRPARHGMLYHLNLGYPFLDRHTKPEAFLKAGETRNYGLDILVG